MSMTFEEAILLKEALDLLPEEYRNNQTNFALYRNVTPQCIVTNPEAGAMVYDQFTKKLKTLQSIT